MFDDLQNQSNQKNKPPLEQPAPTAPKEDISQRIKGLEEQGRKQDKKKTIYSAIGIVVILLFAVGIITAGYYFWPEITVGFNELIGKSEVTNDIVVNNNSENETAENQDNYYQELIKGCEKFKGSVMTTDYDCCIQTVEIMQKNNFRLAPEDGCSNETEINSLWCVGAYNWCEPVKKVEGIDEKEMDITNWQIYRNEEIGVELKYPEDWKISDADSVIYVRSARSNNEIYPFAISISSITSQYQNSRQAFDAKILPGLRTDLDHEIKDIKFNGYNAVSFIDLGITDTTNVVLANVKNIIQVSYITDKQDIPQINQILSTFKFISREEIADIDKDGLNDNEEAQYGTDANNPDSDGDGYLDGDEVKNGYNPIGEGKLELNTST